MEFLQQEASRPWIHVNLDGWTALRHDGWEWSFFCLVSVHEQWKTRSFWSIESTSTNKGHFADWDDGRRPRHAIRCIHVTERLQWLSLLIHVPRCPYAQFHANSQQRLYCRNSRHVYCKYKNNFSQFVQPQRGNTCLFNYTGKYNFGQNSACFNYSPNAMQ